MTIVVAFLSCGWWKRVTRVTGLASLDFLLPKKHEMLAHEEITKSPLSNASNCQAKASKPWQTMASHGQSQPARASHGQPIIGHVPLRAPPPI